jgi:cytoskeletal protein RodZ
VSPDFKKRELTTDQPLGEQLKSVRKTAKLSLVQVSAATKIHRKFLKALEDGDYDAFPGEVYLRGFLENYAKFLGFPADEVLTQYKRERNITAPTKPKLKVPQRRPLERGKLTITPRTLGLAGGALVLLVAIGYLGTQVSGFASPPDLEVFNPVPNATLSADTVEVSGKTDSGAELSINSQPVPTDSNGNFKEQVRVLPGPNTIQITAKNKRGRDRTVARTVVLGSGAATPTPAPTLAPSGMLFQVQIGPNSAYVTINVDGTVAFQGLLVPGSQQVFVSNDRVLLTTSNAGSTKVFINGQDRGTVGNDGQFRRGIEYKVELPAPSPTPAPAK